MTAVQERNKLKSSYECNAVKAERPGVRRPLKTNEDIKSSTTKSGSSTSASIVPTVHFGGFFPLWLFQKGKSKLICPGFSDTFLICCLLRLIPVVLGPHIPPVLGSPNLSVSFACCGTIRCN
jgi:hypothetical protein